MTLRSLFLFIHVVSAMGVFGTLAIEGALLLRLHRAAGTTETWTADAPPADWKMRFSTMILRERLRTFLPALAFVLELAASRR
jgi:hypothetical protein